jgi:hypothetical protein
MINNEELNKQSERILKLIEDAEERFDEDDEMRSHLAKYICILCSGFLENAIHVLYTDYVKCETTSASLISFSSITLNKIQNPNAEKFRDIAKSFNPEWEQSLKDFMQIDDRASAINYIMKDRHKIAHGKDSDITLSRIKEHHLKTKEIIKFIEEQCT